MSQVTLSPPFYLTDEELTEFRQGNLVLHCLSMKLIDPKSKKLIYSGSGCINQTSEGKFQFTLYSRRKTPALEILKDILGKQETRPGQIISEKEFYTLHGIDSTGRRWTGRFFRLDRHASGNGTLCTGRLDEIITRGRLPKPSLRDHMHMDFIGDVEVPFNQTTTVEKTVAGERFPKSGSLNVLKFGSRDYDFILTKDADFWRFAVDTKGKKFSDNLELRIIETLQFLLARPITWSVLVKFVGKTSEIQLRMHRQENVKSRIKPPVPLHLGESEPFINLFSAYLKYVLKYKENKLHPISAQARSIFHASMGSVETEALVLTVSVESVLKYLKFSKEQLSSDEKEWVDKAKEYFKSWGGPLTITERMNGLISMLTVPSAKSQLKRLIEEKIITKRHRDAWDKLRNQLAHGGMLGSMTLQEFLDLTDTVLILFYYIVFHLIGYKGKYMDYSSLGWPVANYPVKEGANV
jgi:hypothetical protein